MSLLGKGHRGRRTALIVAGALGMFQALSLIGAPAASAAVVSCSFGGGILTVNISGTAAFSADASGNITVGAKDTFALGCAAIPAVKATLTNTTAIAVTGSSGADNLTIDLLAKWGKINWTVDLGAGTDTLTLDGSAAPATTSLDSVVGASGFDLNDDGDLDGTVAGVELIAMVGGLGDDYLCGGGSTITGGPTPIAMDVKGGAGGYDDLCGGLGNDKLTGSPDGGAADYLNFTGPITADLQAGTVTGAGSDTLSGLTDLVGSQGNDTIKAANVGSDIAAGPGDDKITGGPGEDTLDFFDSEAGVTVDLAAGTATGDGNDTFTGMEDVFGSDFNDSITSDPNVDNVIDGAAGSDWVDYSAYSKAVTVNLADSTKCSGKSGECDSLVHIENAALGSGDDTFIGSAFNNNVKPGGGANTLTGGGGGDTVDYSDYEAGVTVNLGGGGASTDAFVEAAGAPSSFVNVIGTKFADNITGNSASNTIQGNGGNDTIRGGAGDDTLKGGKGNDTVRGGAGDDDMFGNKGKHDVGFGGGGTDLCKGFETRKGCELH